MKGFAFVFLCAVIAVQSRSASVPSSTTALAAVGENPWLVHLRFAIGTSGFLTTCAGTLIGTRWVLTTESCLYNVRFAWIRYAAEYVINPEMVTETSITTVNQEANLGLMNINRNVEFTDNISPASLSSSVTVPKNARFCAYGTAEGGPGEWLSCFEVSLETDGDSIVAQSDGNRATQFDLGAPLVSDGVLIGILSAAGDEDSAGFFVKPSNHLEWITQVTGIEAD